MNGSRIAGVGVALPDREVSNARLAQRLGVTEEWIFSRTGISTRRAACVGEDPASLGAVASRDALASAQVEVADVDMIVCATITSTMRFPSTGCLIGAALGTQAPAWDLNAGCSGFLFALAQADALVRSGSARRVLVVGADVMSRITDPDDAATAILFGDGAGAVVVESSEQHDLGPFQLHSDGARPELLYTDDRDRVRMKGREVYRAAVNAMSSAVAEVAAAAGLVIQAIDLVVAHQANQRILDAVVERVGLSETQAFSNIASYGNTSAASIPLALFEAQQDGRMSSGDVVIITAFGAGLCWGAGLLRWGASATRGTSSLAGAASA